MLNLCTFARLAGCGLALVLVGCGGDNGPRLASVTGKITIDGKPVSGAGIQMISQEPNGSVAYGMTDESGYYEMAFGQSRKGAFPGKNKVVLNSDSRISVGGEKYDGAEVFPAEYNTKSDKIVEVKDGANVFDFDVKWGDFKPKKPRSTGGT
jgi:hypothetical protein